MSSLRHRQRGSEACWKSGDFLRREFDIVSDSPLMQKNDDEVLACRLHPWLQGLLVPQGRINLSGRWPGERYSIERVQPLSHSRSRFAEE
jgi:hypothetical protein